MDFIDIFADSLHTQGPLDGSLYATILKSPKSPQKSPTFPPAFISNIVNNNHQRSSTNLSIVSSTPKPERTSSTQNLISPPPEFSNKKIVEIKECYTTVSPIGAPSKPESNSSTLNREQSKSLSRSYTSTPSYEEIQVPSRSSSREATLRYQTAPRSTSSLAAAYQQHQHHQQQQQQPQQHPDLPQRSSSVSRAGNYASNQSNQYLRTVDNFNYVNTVQNGNAASRSQSYQDGRESVKSPLTLSMDSGISSSGIANSKYHLVIQSKRTPKSHGFFSSFQSIAGRVQGSSVSPSSYPSQSPQGNFSVKIDISIQSILLSISYDVITKSRLHKAKHHARNGNIGDYGVHHRQTSSRFSNKFTFSKNI